MAYRRKRYQRNYASKSKHNLIATIIIIAVLFFVTINWLLPALVNGVGFINRLFNPTKIEKPIGDDASLAPPVLNIPYEATNSAEIDISGYATPDSKVKIFLDDEEIDEVRTDSDGSFKASGISLNLGTNNIYGKTIDEEERVSLASKTIRLVYDSDKPELEVSSPEDNKEVQGEGKINVSGKTEAGVQLFINSTLVYVKSDGTFSYDFPLSDGDNNLVIKAVDKASNTNEITRRVVKKP